MKPVIKMYVEKGSILPGEESQAENKQTKENRTSKKDLPTCLTTGEEQQWEEVTPKNQEKRKRPLRTRNSRHGTGGRHQGIPSSRTRRMHYTQRLRSRQKLRELNISSLERRK